MKYSRKNRKIKSTNSKKSKNTRKSKNTKKYRNTKKRMAGQPVSGNWINPKDVDINDVCPICTDNFSKDKATYKTTCGHTFHNDCLNQWCEKTSNPATQNTPCPVCRKNINGSDIYDCMDVWAFKNKALGRGDGKPYFNDELLQNIYEKQD